MVFPMHADIFSKTESISAVCRTYGVSRLELFGSAARGADFVPQSSDFDFIVEFVPETDQSHLSQFLGLAGELEALLGRPVDLIEATSIKNPYILAAINQDREVIYAA